MEKIEMYFMIWMYLWVGFQIANRMDVSPFGTFWSAAFWPLGVIIATISLVKDVVKGLKKP